MFYIELYVTILVLVSVLAVHITSESVPMVSNSKKTLIKAMKLITSGLVIFGAVYLLLTKTEVAGCKPDPGKGLSCSYSNE